MAERLEDFFFLPPELFKTYKHNLNVAENIFHTIVTSSSDSEKMEIFQSQPGNSAILLTQVRKM